MIKKIFFQSIFFNFFFLKDVFAAESGGMPQLNPEFWVSQIFWLLITFGILYLVLSKLILPKISKNLESRKSQISENIEAAEKHRKNSDSKLKEYDDIILKSKLEANNIFKEAREKVLQILMMDSLRRKLACGNSVNRNRTKMTINSRVVRSVLLFLLDL